MNGADLREFRRDRKWSQKQLADPLGISKSRVQALESSRGPLPDRIADRLRTVRRCLGCGIPFRPFHKRDKFHSKPCRLAYRKPEMQEYHRGYYEQHSAKAKDRAKKQREARRREVSNEKLKHLRENPRESLCYGPAGETVCLWCGWIGNDLHQHLRSCPGDRFVATARALKPQSPREYGQHWRLALPLISPKQREAYSQLRRTSVTFDGRRQNALKHRGKRTGPRLHTRDVSNRKILEIVAANPGLSLTEGAELTGLSKGGFYKHTRKLGPLGASPAPKPQLEYGRLLSGRELREWIASHPQNFSAASATDEPGSPADEVLQFCIDNLNHGALNPSEFASFTLHLLRELQESPEWIAATAGELAQHKPPNTALRLTKVLWNRRRAELKSGNQNVEPAKPASAIGQRKRGPDKTAVDKTVWFAIGRQVEGLIAEGKSVQEARRKVGKNRTCEYGTIVRYHQRYRAHINKDASDSPMTRLAG